MSLKCSCLHYYLEIPCSVALSFKRIFLLFFDKKVLKWQLDFNNYTDNHRTKVVLNTGCNNNQHLAVLKYFNIILFTTCILNKYYIKILC